MAGPGNQWRSGGRGDGGGGGRESGNEERTGKRKRRKKGGGQIYPPGPGEGISKQDSAVPTQKLLLGHYQDARRKIGNV